MDRYSARINLHGTTYRERLLNRTKDTLNIKLPNGLSYKDVLLNGEETQLIINSGNQTYYKEFQSLPNAVINAGDYVDFANKKWLVTSADADDELYIDGQLEECNWLLKWQNEQGDIVERWAVILSASKYNDGTDGNNVILLGSDQLSVKIPVDKESLRLKKSMSVKFFIDNDSENPTVYELTGTGNVSNTYGGHGVTSWIVKECAYTPTPDDLKYGVCNYKSKSTEGISPAYDNTTNLSFVISGGNTLRCGRFKTWMISFTNSSENQIKDCNFKWNIVSDFNVIQEPSGHKIKLKVNDENCIDSSFLLQVVDENSVLSETKVTVTGRI